jgi:elongation factor 3
MSLLEPPANLLQLLRATEPRHDSSDRHEEILSYVSFLAAGLAGDARYDADAWRDALVPYLAGTGPTIGQIEGWVEEFRRQAEEAALTEQDDATSYGDHDDGGHGELCDLRFNLAYGGKILLHDARLRLLRGRRYALVGQNGVGKTTLMSAINRGKIDGWPHELVTAYVDSGSNVDPDYEAQQVLQHIMDSTGRSEQECVERLSELDFTDAMMHGTIGSLSGGWQMKMRLVRAVLQEPDIFLLDEPTNHLSESAVKWITDYLLSLTDQTVLCVSHDTSFLERIASDVIHYEQRDVWGPYRKLVHYKGKMSAFVEKQPQAKHYFTLATTDQLKFDFPEPGRLEGVKTSTQKFMEMEHVDFRYPGTDGNQLTDINLKMTLSSRVVVLGPNGAGTSSPWWWRVLCFVCNISFGGSFTHLAVVIASLLL